VENADATPSPTEPITAPVENEKPLAGDELLDAVRKQVEYYFSRSNLANDSYLVSQMDAQMFVPLDVIVGFKGVQKLTMDGALILTSVKTSEHLFVDESGPYVKIRPNVTSERSTLILREIPQATPEADVKSLFGEYAAEISTIKSEIGDNWYVHFNGEKPALAAYEFLQTQTFNGNSVRARIKSESFIRSFYAQQGEAGGQMYGGYKGGRGMGKGGYYPQQAMQQGSGMYYTADIDPNMQQRGGRGYGGRGKGGKQQQFMQGGYPQPFQPYAQGGAKAGAPQQAGASTKAKNKKKNKGPKTEVLASPKPQMAAPSLSADDFPALPASPGADKKVGYTGPFKAYTPSEIAAIVAKVGAEGVVPIPDCIPDDSLCKAPQANVVFDSFAAVVKTQ